MLNWDFETERFGPCNLAPEPICLSMYDGDNALVVASCEPEFDDVLAHCLDSEQCNTKIDFDMSVVLAHRPKLAEKVWKAYREERVHCLIVREKLLWLADTGDIENEVLENGAKRKIEYSQAAMELRYLQLDRSADKTDDDAWRTNYSLLKGVPAKDYPTDAFDYSKADSVNGLRILHAQEARHKKMPYSAFGAQHLNVRAALALYLSTCWGFAVDHDEVEKQFAALSERYHE